MIYPGIPQQHQSELPVLTAPATRIPPAFSDSTHQLWRCETEAGPMVLKCCQSAVIESSAFWQGMNSLFAMQFPDTLGSMPVIAGRLRQWGQLVVPEIVAAGAGEFVLTRELAGQDFTASEVTDGIVIALATHLGQLHQQQSTRWGRFPAPHLFAADWPVRLQNTLSMLADATALVIPASRLASVLAKASAIRPTVFAPVMPDLRWDQLRLLDNGELAVIDLDAFVTAPPALELTLLEYLLDARQAKVFAGVYQQFRPLILNQQEREVYRLLLFLMHVLGAQDLEPWLAAPAHFN